jgi:hypothetical protein
MSTTIRILPPKTPLEAVEQGFTAVKFDPAGPYRV